jgi:peptide/nickel transport system permease protein
MRAYIIRRLLLTIPTLLIVTIVVFFLIRLIPGDVIDLMLIEKESQWNIDRDELEHRLGLDVPIHVQYVRWIFGVVQGDLGESLWTKRSVLGEILHRFPVTFELALIAITVSLFIALPIGTYSAIRQYTIGDYLGRSLAIAFIAVPSFWLGTMIMVFPSIWWGWSPPMEYIPFTENPLRNIGMLIIPGTILGMYMSGTIMRMTRTMMLEVLRQDYIRTAWAKGLSERAVVVRHALKNALIPVVTIVGLRLPILIGGAVIIERIFNLPGIGWSLIGVISDRDYSMLSGINLFVATLVVLINLAVDLTYAYLDPRILYR